MEIINSIGNIFLSQAEFWWFASLLLFAWVWTVKTDNVDTAAATFFNDLQDLKVDTDRVPILQNLLGGSDFGTWSQSDANKGIGYLDFDSGSVVPVVGETLTGATSSATGKVIWVNVSGGTWGGGDAAGTVYLGDCSTGCFNDDELITGSVGGVNIMTVNQPDAALGTDGIIKNGAFVHDVDPPTSWAIGSSALLTTEAGGQVGNCLMITENGATNPYTSQYPTVTPGKIYKFSIYVKQGTESTYRVILYDLDNGADIWNKLDEAGAGWTQLTFTFEAPSGCSNIRLRLYQMALLGAATTIYYDEVTLYEITPCCTAADSVAWDGDEWTKDATLDLYREHWDGGTNTKEGSFYALKCVPSAASDYVNWKYDLRSSVEHLARFYGRTVAIGMWVKTSTANHFRINMYEGGGTSIYSDYHTGGGTWEWIEVPITYGTAGVYIYMQWRMYQPPNIDGSTIVYISQPMLIFGKGADAIIGEGNYRAKPQEEILTKKKIPSNLLDGQASLDDVAVADLNLEADSDAMLPKGCKAVKIFSQCNDAGSAGADCYLRFRADATKDYEYYNSPYGLANDCDSRTLGWQQCDQYGDIDYNIEEAGGASGFDIDQMDYVAVQVN